MGEPFRVLQVGLGSIGVKIAENIIRRENLELKAVVDISPDLRGQTVEGLLSIQEDTRTPIYGDLQEAIDAIGPVDAALVATSSSLKTVAPTIKTCLEAGMDVVSICEQLSFPHTRYPEISKDLDETAKKTERSVLGTGINPGFLMDTLPILLSAPIKHVDSIRVTRVINSSKRRKSFQLKIGTGMTVEQFRDAISTGKITGHVGLSESLWMVNAALNLGLDEIVEIPPEPVLTEKEVTTPIVSVKKGDVIGLKSVGLGKRNGETIVTLDFTAHAGAEPEYDAVEINGEPSITQRIEGGVHGDNSTIAMALNMIPLVIRAAPGLYTMKDLPCPRNTERLWRDE